MNDHIIAIIRTIVPMLAGAAITFLATYGIEIESAALEAVLFPIISGAYYVVARALASTVPAFGWLLGHPAKPEYTLAA